METLYLSKQRIIDINNRPFAYELVFKDSSNKPLGFSNSLKATAKLIINSINTTELDKLLGKNSLAFINVDEVTLTKGILDVLDKKRFVLNILEDINLTESVIKKIVDYKKKGFLFSLEHFDSSARMINKFQRLFNYIDIIKMDIISSEIENLEKVMLKFKETRINLLAQGVESKEDLEDCREMGFDYFQGYYLNKPEVIAIGGATEPTQIIIMRLIKIIKDNDTTEELESFIKRQPDLSYKLIQFFNNIAKLEVRVESLTQVITMMGRNKLLRWLLVYLYSEVSEAGASKTILDLALRRAESMEAEANKSNKDKAYLAGMFSLLSSIFETDIQVLMSYVNMDTEITKLVLYKKGIFASSLLRAENAEKEYLQRLMMKNFEKLNTIDLVATLEDGGVDIDRDEIKG